jgi:arginyl-tRNA synthetase
MVALSHATARELGYGTQEGSGGPGDVDAKKPFVEVSGRKGLGVKIDDLLDLLTDKAAAEVARRNPEFSADECRRVGSQIAVAAIRYFMLKYSRGKLIVFDIEEALSFEGETGPYLQYAAVRARNILRKLEEKGERLPDFSTELSPAALARQLQSEDFWQVLLAASKADSAVERAVTAGEPAHVAKYAFQLAQAFNNFYHQYPIIHEQDREKKVFLLWMTDFFRRQLERTADILGIQIPTYM